MTKTIISFIIICLAAVLILSACGNKDSNISDDAPENKLSDTVGDDEIPPETESSDTDTPYEPAVFEPFQLDGITDILGFDYEIRVEETSYRFCVWKFYWITDGEIRCVGEMFGPLHDDTIENNTRIPDAYVLDLDGDGITELICNCVYGADGGQEVRVFRNNGGVVELGTLSIDYFDGKIDGELISHLIAERYDPDVGFTVTYFDGEEMQTDTFSGIDNFKFEPFTPESE